MTDNSPALPIKTDNSPTLGGDKRIRGRKAVNYSYLFTDETLGDAVIDLKPFWKMEKGASNDR